MSERDQQSPSASSTERNCEHPKLFVQDLVGWVIQFQPCPLCQRDRLREVLERIDAHLELRPGDPLENLQVVAGYGNSQGFWLALKAARKELASV